MQEFRWASGPEEPTLAEREAAQDIMDEDARARLRELDRAIDNVETELSELEKLLQHESCPYAREQLDGERKYHSARLATMLAEYESTENFLEGK